MTQRSLAGWVLVVLLAGVVQCMAADSDGDGLPDDWEITYGLSPTDSTGDNGASGDPDGDQLNNLYEYMSETSPKNVDTDGDSIKDKFEDYDGDGLQNIEEQNYGTAPNKMDTDDDRLSDLAEVAQYGTSPTAADTDSDGMQDGDEVQAGTEPTNSNSVFRIENSDLEGSNAVLVRWSSVSNKEYSVMQASGLPGAFAPLATGIPATPPTNTYTANVVSANERYYRVEVQ